MEASSLSLNHQLHDPTQFLEEVAVIALFGATGAGKSTFANLASGQDDLEVGHGIESCTQEVGKTTIFKVGERPVVLIDCPGFDDSHASDAEILKRIAGFLTFTYSNNIKLTGILYLHRITDNRFGGASRRNFRMFRKMCGTESLQNVVVVTNMWSQPPTELQLARESQLRDGEDAFKLILAEGAQMIRHSEPTRESALSIVRCLLDKKPIVLDLSRQLVDQKRELEDTSAGREVAGDIADALRKHQADIEQLKRDQVEAVAENDKKWENEIAESEKKASAASRALEHQMESLKQGHHSQQAEWQKTFMETQDKYLSRLADMQKQYDERANKTQAEFFEKMSKMKEESDKQQAQAQDRTEKMQAEYQRREEQARAQAEKKEDEYRRQQTQAQYRAEQKEAESREQQKEAQAKAEKIAEDARRKQEEITNQHQAAMNKMHEQHNQNTDKLTRAIAEMDRGGCIIS